jgi:hypothetical protein
MEHEDCEMILFFTVAPSAEDAGMSWTRTLIAMALVLSILTGLVSCGGGEKGVVVIIGPVEIRQGEVGQFQLTTGADAEWSVAPADAGLIDTDGRFVGYRPGPATITAGPGDGASLTIMITPRNGPSGVFSVVGRGLQVERYTSDLWVANSFGYTGTWLGRDLADRAAGDRLLAWDLADPAAPRRTAEVIVDARTLNDVKIRADGALAVLTHEDSGDGLNGVTLLDLADPLVPTVITRFTEELEPGVHNVWLEGDFLYAAVDGNGNGLRVLDISNPAQPAIVAGFAAETSFLHDVLVRDGLAFLSHWDAGLIILDVGHGIAGGTPAQPVEVSRILTEGGQTHNAWYWPEAGYVFVGERDFATPGRLHVVDVRDLRAPREVATFFIPADTPHNFWLDEERGILYAAWYTAGLVAIDVSGELLGELEKQGREIATLRYGSDAGCNSVDGTCAWAPQLHQGLVFLSDLNTGLWVFAPQF